jgi:tubulin beta
MVREIVHCQVGQCGNQVGNQFWQKVLTEHCLTAEGKFNQKDKRSKLGIDAENSEKKPTVLEQVDVYFAPSGSRNFVPRAVMVDLEPGTADVLRQSDIGKIFKPDNFVFGASGAGNNWAKGHYTEGAEIIEEVLEVLRKEVENCDCPQGFQICHSLGGGTGSGMGTLLLLKIRDSYPDRMNCTFSVFPSPKVSDTVVEPYNAVLSSHQLLENSDETFIIDNEALYNISNNILNNNSPTYADLNELIGQVVCGITASLRFPGQLNGDIRKLAVNLVPFPRLHFFLVSQAPLVSQKNKSYVKLNVQELCTQMYQEKNFYANVKKEDGKSIACTMIFRGELSSSEIDTAVADLQDKHDSQFVEWIPNNVKTSVVDIGPTTSAVSATFVCNSTSLKGIFQRLATQFGAMYKRKAFLHWYKGEGMDEMEFQEADKNIRDLITEYQDKQDAVAEEDESAEEDDDTDV